MEMTEQAHGSEDLLQALLAKHPSLLAGHQIGAAPRQWLLVCDGVTVSDLKKTSSEQAIVDSL